MVGAEQGLSPRQICWPLRWVQPRQHVLMGHPLDPLPLSLVSFSSSRDGCIRPSVAVRLLMPDTRLYRTRDAVPDPKNER
jgi:hypothetical protein